MLLLILLGIFTAFLSLAFALLHLMASLSELRKHKNTGSIISVVGKTTVEIIEGSVAKFQNEQY